MKITSSAFQNAERIPEKYTCDGDQFLSPPLHITGIPETAQSLALVMDDPDVPKAFGHDTFTHWVLFNIPPSTSRIPEGETAGTPGVNTRGDARYTGPCPSSDYEPSIHRYFFKIYALDTMLDLPEGTTKKES
jgi:Raf kinase inhibitor-like YbhB/YbcL family protein